MGIAFWFSLLKLLLTLAANVAGTIRTKQAMDAGEQKQIAKMLKQIFVNGGIAREVELQTAAMTPEAILRDLEGNNELRD